MNFEAYDNQLNCVQAEDNFQELEMIMIQTIVNLIGISFINIRTTKK